MSDLDTYLKRKASILTERREQLHDNPDAGFAQIKASSYVAGITGIRPVTMGDYVVNTDSAPGLAGHSLGPSSPELLLGALASCLAHTYVLQAALHDVSLQQVSVEVTGALNMADAINPSNDRTIAIENLGFRANIQSDAADATMQKLHSDVERACAVLNTLRAAHTVTRHT